jgi:gliding motility-associated-like protein
MTMSGHILTQVFERFFLNFDYFTTNNLTLKRSLIFATTILIAFAAAAQSYNNIEFIENKGQWDSKVQYKGNVSNGAFYIRSGGFTVVQHNPADFAGVSRFLHGHTAAGLPVKPTDKFVLRSHAWHVDFIGASEKIQTVPDKVISTYNNYFIGNDQSKWSSGCRIFQAITLKEVYPNIDVRYYTDNDFLKYDIIVKPGGDVSRIALRYDGVDRLQVKNRELVIGTSVGDLKESAPYTYQSSLNGKAEITCKYVVKDNIVRFEVKNYDPSQTLIIDPVVVFGSFSGSSADNWGFTATYGPDGSMFGGGIVLDAGGFPVSPGAFQTTYSGGTGNTPSDIGIIKLSPNGNSRLYATYIGGGSNDQPHSLVVDNQGNLVMAGRSNSANYPVVSPGGQIGPGGGYDIVVTKLNATGTALIGSKKIGGTGNDGVNISETRDLNSLQRNYGDDGRSEVILDAAGNVYLASCTQSNNFPVTAGAFQTTYGGGIQDGVVLKLNANLSALSFASYLGGSGNDAAYVLSLRPGTSEIYVGGGTESGNLPGNTAGTIGTANQGGIDGFVSVISNNGGALLRSTYLGTTAIDQVFGVQFDRSGYPYVMGQTTGAWPVRNATFSNSGGKQFIAKLEPDLSAYVYSTVFGSGASTPNISPIAFLVDRCENVYISGWGGFFFGNNVFGSAGTTGLPITPDAFKNNTDGKDLYFFVLKKNATDQLFGSFYGENNPNNAGCDHVDGGTSRFDSEGVIYQAICGNCKLNLPPINPIPGLVTAGAWSTTNNSPNCNLTMIKIAMNLAGVDGGIQSAIDGRPRDTAGCVPLMVDFRDTVGTAQSYEWYFGDGSPMTTTTTPSTAHQFNAVGTYQVMLVAIDPNTCNVRDSSFLTIRVGNLETNLDFDFLKLPPCQSFTYQFTNLSVAPLGPAFNANTFTWDFGDGSPLVQAGAAPVVHNYAGPGTYNVKLILTDTRYCNAPDTLIKVLSVASNVRASFTTPSSGCHLYTPVFRNTSIAGQSWLWNFGDGNTSTAFEPTHTYAAPGTYNVVLIANNPNTCNLADTTAAFTITVFDSPIPNFSFAPVPPLENTPVTFTNLSSPDAVRFRWDFGDGDTLRTSSRAPVFHQYNATGTFNACLTAYNAIGCDSTVCQPIVATIIPLVDVPNAFTPNSGDINSVLLVRGFGIAKMQFVIWNRWGQKVFETNDRFRGWDGKVKGALQPMDVYVYTLNIEFSDGTKTTKKGDITLIR